MLEHARLSIAVLAAVAIVFSAAEASAGDPGRGKAVFAQQCGICHTATHGGPTLVGPNLFGIEGRKAGAFPGYSYSPSLRAAGFTWTSDKLRAWITGPASVVPGNKMPFAGLKNPTQVDDLVTYLATLK